MHCAPNVRTHVRWEEAHTGDFDKIHARIRKIRELKMETFSGRRRPDWQRKPGTKAAVASRQKQNIKIAVNSEGLGL